MNTKTKSRMFLTITATVVVFSSSIAFGQHFHEQHPTTSHGQGPHGGYHRISLEPSGHEQPIVKLDYNKFETIFTEWLVNSTCNDGVERGNEYTRSVTHKVHVQLTAGAEWGYEAGAKFLAAELKSTAKAKVELNGGWEGTWTEELGFSSKFLLNRCQKIWYYFGLQKKVASGKVLVYSHRFRCQCDGCSQTYTNYCGKKYLNGNATGWDDYYGEHVQRGLVNPCPCNNIDEDSSHVFDPNRPVVVPDVVVD